MSFKLSAFADEVSNELARQISYLNGKNIEYLEIRSLDGKNVGDLTLTEAKETYRKPIGDCRTMVLRYGR